MESNYVYNRNGGHAVSHNSQTGNYYSYGTSGEDLGKLETGYTSPKNDAGNTGTHVYDGNSGQVATYNPQTGNYYSYGTNGDNFGKFETGYFMPKNDVPYDNFPDIAPDGWDDGGEY